MSSAPRRLDEAAPAAAVLRRRLRGLAPKVAIVLGSGLGAVAEAVQHPIVVDYASLPGFPPPGVSGHRGQVVAGELGGTPVICLAGRAHAYEALPMPAYRVPVRTMRRLGVEILLLTNAAGSLKRAMRPGQLMLIRDHINLLGFNPLAGANDERYGVRFPEMSRAYDPALSRGLRRAARAERIPLAEGVYLACPGPSFETPAEIRAFRRLGADAVGMSTVPETIVARHCGLRVAALSVITNLAAGIGRVPPSHAETLSAASGTARTMTRLLTRFLSALG